MPLFPLLQDFVLREDDKDPTSTSLPEKNNEDRYFGKQYQRRQQKPVLVEQQVQLSEPKVRTHTCETLEDTLNETNLDDLPIYCLEKRKKILCQISYVPICVYKKTFYPAPEFSFSY